MPKYSGSLGTALGGFGLGSVSKPITEITVTDTITVSTNLIAVRPVKKSGTLGTALGSFILGLDKQVNNINIQLIVDSITVSQPIVGRSDNVRQTLTTTITVNSSALGRSDTSHQSVTSSIGVSDVSTGRDATIHQTTISTVSVSQTLAARNNVIRMTVTDTIGVSQTPFGRNNNVRLTVTTAINVANPNDARDANNREAVTTSISILDVASPRNTGPRLTVIQTVSTHEFIDFRNTNPRITLTQGISVVSRANAEIPRVSVIDTITVGQTIGQRNTNQRITVTTNVTVTEAITPHNTNPRITVTDNISVPTVFPNPIVAWNSNARIGVFEFIAVTSTPIDNSTHQYVVTNVNVGQTISPNFKSVGVLDTIVVIGTIAGGPNPRVISVTDAITVATLAQGRSNTERMTDTIRVLPTIFGQGPLVSQTIVDSILVSGAAEFLTLSQQHVQDHIFLNDAIKIGAGNKNLEVTDSITVTPVIRDSPINLTVEHTAVVGQRIRQLDITVVQPITVTTVANKRADVTIHDTLIFDQELTGQKIMTHTIADTLVFAEEANRSVVWHRTLSDLIVFPDQYYIRATSISADPIVVPIATGTIVSAKTVVLRSGPGGAIVLSAPLFDDSQANVNGITIRRTMNGGTYSFVKSSDRQKLVWTFKIAHVKAIELRAWIVKSISEVIHITDWQGRTWTAKLTVNPPSLSADGRFAPELEYIDVELQFDAVKLSG